MLRDLEIPMCLIWVRFSWSQEPISKFQLSKIAGMFLKQRLLFINATFIYTACVYSWVISQNFACITSRTVSEYTKKYLSLVTCTYFRIFVPQQRLSSHVFYKLFLPSLLRKETHILKATSQNSTSWLKAKAVVWWAGALLNLVPADTKESQRW
jgi:hypothetical protein